MTLLEDGRLYPCNRDGAWRDEGEMLSRWIGLQGRGWRYQRDFKQWWRLAMRDRGWREYAGVTRSPRCMGHVPGRQGFGSADRSGGRR